MQTTPTLISHFQSTMPVHKLMVLQPSRHLRSILLTLASGFVNVFQANYVRKFTWRKVFLFLMIKASDSMIAVPVIIYHHLYDPHHSPAFHKFIKL